MKLEQSLILNRYFDDLFGVQGLEGLKPILSRIEEGTGGDGQSRFFDALAGIKGLKLSQDRLRAVDTRVVGYEASPSR